MTELETNLSEMVAEREKRIAELEAENAELKKKFIVWHKVVDGDLPPAHRIVLNQVGMATQYDPRRGFLGFGGAGIIAWCEIPTYTEE